MIDSGTRVVVFLDAGADGSDGGVVDFILPEFPMVSPTSYSCDDESHIFYSYLSDRSGRHHSVLRTLTSLVQWTASRALCQRLITCT